MSISAYSETVRQQVFQKQYLKTEAHTGRKQDPTEDRNSLAEEKMMKETIFSQALDQRKEVHYGILRCHLVPPLFQSWKIPITWLRLFIQNLSKVIINKHKTQ